MYQFVLICALGGVVVGTMTACAVGICEELIERKLAAQRAAVRVSLVSCTLLACLVAGGLALG